jgi:hypothetical protein
MMESSDILKCELDPANMKKDVFQCHRVILISLLMCCFHLTDEMAPKMKRSKLAKLVSEGEKSGIIPSILKDWRNDKTVSSPILEERRKRDAAVGTSQQVPGVVTHDRKLTASSSVPNVSTNVTTSIPAHNSSGPARSDVSSQQMSIPNLDDMFTRKCRSVQGEIKIKVPNPDYWIKHFPEFVDNGESASKSVWNVANSYFELVDSLTQKEDGERMNNAGDVGVCEASLSYLLRALCGIRHLEESTYNREYLLEMQGKTRRSCKKGWMILVVLSKKSETCGQRLRG